MIVVAGGFSELTTVKFDVSSLRADHEGDTRLILHCIHAHMNMIVVSIRETDMLLLLLAHHSRIDCTRIYIKAGTSKAPKYFPVRDIHQNLSVEQLETLLAYHAVTGCDIVCPNSVVTVKKTAWQVFQQ